MRLHDLQQRINPGVVLIPNELYKVTPPANRVLRISSAALDLKGTGKSKASLIVMDATKSQEFVICNLIADVIPHSHLDLFFVGDREVAFKVVGNSNIHLTGYTTFVEAGLEQALSESDMEDIIQAAAKKPVKAKIDQKATAQKTEQKPEEKEKKQKTIVEELKEDNQPFADSDDEDELFPLKGNKPIAETGGPHDDLGLGLDDDDDDDDDDLEDLLGGAKKKPQQKRKAPESPHQTNGSKKRKLKEKKRKKPLPKRQVKEGIKERLQEKPQVGK